MTDRSEHRWVVDGIEEGMARIEEDGTRMIVVPAYLLPASAREGQILRVTRGRHAGTTGEAVTFTVRVDDGATEEALARSRETVARASAESRRRDPGGDVAL
jgi:hypothetical protein